MNNQNGIDELNDDISIDTNCVKLISVSSVRVRGNRMMNRKGFISIEILVAASLLIVIVSGYAALQYRLLGVAKDAKHYQLALHEAANQISMLQGMTELQLEDGIEKAYLPEDVLRSLPNGKLFIEKIVDQKGTRVKVRILWDRAGAPSPVELTGWISTGPTGDQTQGEVRS